MGRDADGKKQRERFIETARKLGADETGETFERAFARIAPPRKAGEKATKPDVPKKARRRDETGNEGNKLS